jgi:glycosyltransferase involved in cell wall biosynthesis
VGAVVPAKGQDVLVEALARLTDLEWSCRVVGPLDRDPDFSGRVRAAALAAGLGGRVRLTGPLPPSAVAAVYAESDLLVLPTRLEAYGMVLTEALARGLPVVASGVGGVAEAVGRSPDGALPGVLVPPGDPEALADTLRTWLTDPAWRERLRAAAGARRAGLGGWSATARAVDAVLREVSVNRSGTRHVVTSW